MSSLAYAPSCEKEDHGAIVLPGSEIIRISQVTYVSGIVILLALEWRASELAEKIRPCEIDDFIAAPAENCF